MCRGPRAPSLKRRLGPDPGRCPPQRPGSPMLWAARPARPDGSAAAHTATSSNTPSTTRITGAVWQVRQDRHPVYQERAALAAILIWLSPLPDTPWWCTWTWTSARCITNRDSLVTDPRREVGPSRPVLDTTGAPAAGPMPRRPCGRRPLRVASLALSVQKKLRCTLEVLTVAPWGVEEPHRDQGSTSSAAAHHLPPTRAIVSCLDRSVPELSAAMGGSQILVSHPVRHQRRPPTTPGRVLGPGGRMGVARLELRACSTTGPSPSRPTVEATSA